MSATGVTDAAARRWSYCARSQKVAKSGGEPRGQTQTCEPQWTDPDNAAARRRANRWTSEADPLVLAQQVEVLELAAPSATGVLTSCGAAAIIMGGNTRAWLKGTPVRYLGIGLQQRKHFKYRYSSRSTAPPSVLALDLLRNLHTLNLS